MMFEWNHRSFDDDVRAKRWQIRCGICFSYDWVLAIVNDNWTNCEKIIMHLKNQRIFVLTN